MKKRIQWLSSSFLLVATFFFLPSTSTAQDIKGIVHELESSQRIPHVLVKNLRTNHSTETDKEGNFKIPGQLNDLLSFTQTGYETDTAFIYEEGIQRVYLNRENNSIVIDEIVITRLTDSRLTAEIDKAYNQGKSTDVSQARGGIRISPSRLFGKKSRLARKSLQLLLQEQASRKVDKQFTDQLIASLTPLSETEIALFKAQYRPSVTFIESASPEDLKIYILDAYRKFKK